MESFGIAVFLSLGCCKFDNGYDASQLIDALIESHLARREGRRREGRGKKGDEGGRGEARTIKRCIDRAALLSVKDISLNNKYNNKNYLVVQKVKFCGILKRKAFSF